MKKWHEIALIVLLLCLTSLAAWLDPKFLSMAAQAELSKSFWQIVVISLPMTFVILMGGIDLSVGAIMSLSAVAMGLMKEANQPWPLIILFGLAVSALCGLANALLVTKLKIHPLIVTLATMSAFFGLAEGISHARPISNFPSPLAQALNPTMQFLISVVIVVVSLVWFAKSVRGQLFSSIGFNETATTYSGLPVESTKSLAYVLSGLASGIAAIFFVAIRNTAKADIGQGMELQVVTAVVLGGTSVAGGRGGILGTLLGGLLVYETRCFINWHFERDELNLIVTGLLLIFAVFAKNVIERSRIKAK